MIQQAQGEVSYRELYLAAGFLEVNLDGVSLFADSVRELYYIDTTPDFSNLTDLKVIEEIANSVGLEPINEHEAPAVELPDGGLRIHLAEAWEPSLLRGVA